MGQKDMAGDAGTKVVRIPLSKLRRGDKLAEGGFAVLHTAMNGGGQVVVRQLRRELRFNFKLRRRFLDGIAVRRRCADHPNIVQYVGEGGSLFALPYEIIEFVPGSNLKMLIVKRHEVTWKCPLDILRQSAAAMMHIHQLGYLHLDIKPENHLVDPAGGKPRVKLSDFDLCQPVSLKEAPKGFGGSRLYLAPEYLERKEISVGTDIFAFGVMAFNLYTNQLPFPDSAEIMLRDDKFELKYPMSSGREVPPEVKDIINRCLKRFPAMRFKHGGELFTAIETLYQKERAGRK